MSKTKLVTISIDEDLHAKIKEAAEKDDRSVSSLIASTMRKTFGSKETKKKSA